MQARRFGSAGRDAVERGIGSADEDNPRYRLSSPLYPPPACGEVHWPPQLTVLVAIALQLLLPNRLSVGSRWILPPLEAIMLLALFVGSPQRLLAPHSLRRVLMVGTTALVSIANGVALVLLGSLLLHHAVTNGHELIIAGADIWLTNVFVFSLWYWEIDRGGPGRRAGGTDGAPDLLFPQMTQVERFSAWRPLFVDYLYVSLTNATAFSPTDTLPLTARIKLLMSLQSLISLVTIGLVVSRAVNIL